MVKVITDNGEFNITQSLYEALLKNNPEILEANGGRPIKKHSVVKQENADREMAINVINGIFPHATDNFKKVVEDRLSIQKNTVKDILGAGNGNSSGVNSVVNFIKDILEKNTDIDKTSLFDMNTDISNDANLEKALRGKINSGVLKNAREVAKQNNARKDNQGNDEQNNDEPNNNQKDISKGIDDIGKDGKINLEKEFILNPQLKNEIIKSEELAISLVKLIKAINHKRLGLWGSDVMPKKSYSKTLNDEGYYNTDNKGDSDSKSNKMYYSSDEDVSKELKSRIKYLQAVKDKLGNTRPHTPKVEKEIDDRVIQINDELSKLKKMEYDNNYSKLSGFDNDSKAIRNRYDYNDRTAKVRSYKWWDKTKGVGKMILGGYRMIPLDMSDKNEYGMALRFLGNALSSKDTKVGQMIKLQYKLKRVDNPSDIVEDVQNLEAFYKIVKSYIHNISYLVQFGNDENINKFIQVFRYDNQIREKFSVREQSDVRFEGVSRTAFTLVDNNMGNPVLLLIIEPFLGKTKNVMKELNPLVDYIMKLRY